jgi:cytochrome d ubiquinol oxidase subunit II
MTWVALLFTPVVLAHQGWTYWVFRHRVSGTPVLSLLPPKPSSGPPASGPAAHAPSGL